MGIRISVIICTHNRARLLEKALQCLRVQTLPHDQFEIIIIDNASSDDTKKVVSNFMPEIHNLSYVFEGQVGLSHARNRGIKEAKGEIIVYLDDDAESIPGWAEAIYLAYTHDSSIDALGGPVMLDWEGRKKPRWANRYLDYALSYQYYGDEVREVSHLNGCNLAIKKSVLQTYHGFDESLGRKGKQMLAGEESKLLKEMREDKRKIVYDPEMAVSHFVPFSRQKAGYFLKVYYGFGVSGSIGYGYCDFKNMLKMILKLFPRLVSIMSEKPRLNFLGYCMVCICEACIVLGFCINQITLLIPIKKSLSRILN